MFELSYPTRPRSPARPSTRAIQKLPIKARFIAREEGYLMAKTKDSLHDIGDAEPDRPARQQPRKRRSTCASSTPPDQLGEHRRAWRAVRKQVARIDAELREREIAAAESNASGSRRTDG